MTDEEKLAKEYVKSVIDVDAFDWKIGREIGLAYISGLKAGSLLDKVWHDYDAGEDCYEDSHEGKWVKRETSRPKWHKVADGDLPKGNCENILLYNKDHFCVTHSYSLGYYENGVFYNDCEMEEDTIAWCEIPQYEEE